MSETLLVTGGAGYIGSHFCQRAAREGYRPVVYDNLTRGNRWAVQWGPLEVGDLADSDRLRETFRRHRPAAVVHFAALAYVGESVRAPDAYYRNNVAGTLALLDAMREHGVARIVFSSSCATYGVPETLPIPETHPQRPMNPYGRTKLIVEHALRDYAEAFAMRPILLRYFNAAGSDPDGEIGEWHDPETHLIPNVLRAALDGGQPIRVFGTDYPTPDGTCVRDYAHVADIAAAHLLALARLEATSDVEAFNLGTGDGASVREVIEAAERVTGKTIPVVHEPRRPGDPPALVADPTNARSALGWTPRYAALETQIEHAWNWLRRRSDG